MQLLTAVPGAVLPLLPSATCPGCVAAYAGVASAVGLGFLLTERVLAPLIAVFLAINVLGLAWSTRGHRRTGPLALTAVASAAVVSGRFLWGAETLVYSGASLLVAASLWNLWVKRAGVAPFVRIRMQRKKGAVS